MTKPLEGYKVIEIAQEIQGPFASMLLAYMGASVVKVERDACLLYTSPSPRD